MKDAVSGLRRGMCVVYPTSTQPALGCLPTSESLDLLFSLKNRAPTEIAQISCKNVTGCVTVTGAAITALVMV